MNSIISDNRNNIVLKLLIHDPACSNDKVHLNVFPNLELYAIHMVKKIFFFS